MKFHFVHVKQSLAFSAFPNKIWERYKQDEGIFLGKNDRLIR